MLRDALTALESRRVRYLLAGGWNTLFGYGAGVSLYLLLSKHLHIAIISILANAISITMSFVTYKIFVFRSKGRWVIEYLRSYVVYGSAAIFGVGFLWLLVKGLDLNIWIAQAVVIIATIGISYFGHGIFTFRSDASGRSRQ